MKGKTTPGGDIEVVRRILVVLVVVGVGGLLVELLLLEHTVGALQWIPLVTLAVALPAAALLALRPSRAVLRVHVGAMALLVVTGLGGLYLHLRGNVAFERELEPETVGLAMVWNALRGATPTLAPGAFVQLGLLGLVLSYRHPVLSPSSREDPS